MPGDRPQQARAILDLGDDLDLVLAQQRHEPLAQQREILGDHYPHGRLTSTTRALARRAAPRRSVPSSASTRARSPASPEPVRVGAAAAVVADEHRPARGRSSLQAHPAAPRARRAWRCS